MEISVILPTFNGANFIRQAIGTVLNEPGVRQLIVVDDASEDGTVHLVRQLARSEPRIEVTRFSSNQGVAAARNRGVSLARFDWLGFIDQDDLWERSRTSVLSRHLHDSPDSIVLGRVRHFFDEEVVSPPALTWARQEWTTQSYSGWVLGAMLVSAKTFKHVGLFDESLKSGTDDFDWFARAQQRGIEILHATEVVLARRLHLSNTSGSKTMIGPEILRIVRSHLAVAKGKR